MTYQNIVSNGGGTYNPDGTKHYKTEGYFIGGRDCTEIKAESIKSDTPIKSIIDKYLTFSRLDGYDFAGFWIDDSILYIERVTCIKNKQHAINQGIRNKQIAIYDIANDNCITLD